MAVSFLVSWADNHEPGSHVHYAWEPWSTRQLWTMVSDTQRLL
jgi:hypothetical protein